MSDRIYSGGNLTPNSSITSLNSKYILCFQGDGNLVLYKAGSGYIWASYTQGKPATDLLMRSDGNLVIYDLNGQPIWTSGTGGHPGAWLLVQNDGNLVIYSTDKQLLWASRTVQYDNDADLSPVSPVVPLPSPTPAPTPIRKSKDSVAYYDAKPTLNATEIEAVAEQTIGKYKKMLTKAKLFKNGLLSIETFSENTHPVESMQGKVLVACVDVKGQVQKLSQEYKCSTRGGKYNLGRSSQGINIWFEQLPEAIGLQTSHLVIYQYDGSATLPEIIKTQT